MASVLDQLELRIPLVQAPMSGFTTPELVAACSEAGALGSIGAAYMDPGAIGQAAESVRRLTARPFGLNLFVMQVPSPREEEVARIAKRLEPFCRELGVDPPTLTGPAHPDVDKQIEAVLAVRPAVFSFAMGMPSRAVLQECRRLGIVTVGTATTLAEGLALDEAGVDVICAQGSEAGGHRSTFIGPVSEALVGVLPLTSMLAARLDVPVIAAGGIMNGAAASAMLRAGAAAVQLGTAFLPCPETAAAAAHKEILFSKAAERTALTRAFSGREARGVVNRYMLELEHARLGAFPILNAMTRGLRAAAAKAGRTEFMSLWAGQGAPLARRMPAGELVETLAAEMKP